MAHPAPTPPVPAAPGVPAQPARQPRASRPQLRGGWLSPRVAGHAALLGTTAVGYVGSVAGGGAALLFAGLSAAGLGAAALGGRQIAKRRGGLTSRQGRGGSITGPRRNRTTGLGSVGTSRRRPAGGTRPSGGLLGKMARRRAAGANSTRHRTPGLSRLTGRHNTGRPGTRYNPNSGRVPGRGRVASATHSTGRGKRGTGGSRLPFRRTRHNSGGSGPGRTKRGTGRVPGSRRWFTGSGGSRPYGSKNNGGKGGKPNTNRWKPWKNNTGKNSGGLFSKIFGAGGPGGKNEKGDKEKKPRNDKIKDTITPASQNTPNNPRPEHPGPNPKEEKTVTAAVPQNGGRTGRASVPGRGSAGGNRYGAPLVQAAEQYVQALQRIDTSTARGKEQYLEALAEAKRLIAEADEKIVAAKLGEEWGDHHTAGAFAGQAKAGHQLSQAVQNVLAGFRRRNREKYEHLEDPGRGHNRHGWDVSRNEG